MSTGRLVRLLAVLTALALFGAACGGGGSTPEDGVADASSDAESDDTSADTSTEGADDEDPDGEAGDTVNSEATDTTEAEAEEPVDQSDFGIDANNVLVGPSGFTIDLDECPDGWDDEEGVTGDSVTLGTSWPYSGSLAAFGLIADGMENYFQFLNETEDGIGGREITLVKKDDAYEPARVVSNVGELMEQDNVFAMATLAGTPGNLAVYDQLNEACVPHMFASTGHPAWGDPNFHPWSTPNFLAYNTEARIWGRYIEDQVAAGDLEAPVSVAALVMNNDFGLAYQNEFEAFAADSDAIGEVTYELHDSTAPNVTNELTTLAGTEADVALLMTTSVYCTQSFTGVAQSAWDPELKLFSNTCAGIESFFVPAGEAGEGWRYAGHGKDISDAAWADDPFVAQAREYLEKSELDPDKSQYGNGWSYAWANATAMNAADELPGGLTRTNLMLATRQMDTKNPLNFDGILWKLDGAIDAYPTEAAAILEYQIPDGETTGGYAILSDIISAEGESGLCHFVDGACINE